jgi:hypothetical protein
MVAVPLAAAAMACVYVLTVRSPPARLPISIVEQCKRSAELLYDISWAAECMKTADDSADCTLPNAQAAKVNGILAAEEARCMAAESHAKSEH